jgi:hypothetical protein
MAEKKFFVDINLQGSALTNATIGTNSSLTKAGSFGFDGTRLKYFNGTAIEEVANLADVAAVTGGLIFQGGYDPTTDTPDITDGTAYKGFFWAATAAGTFLGESVQVGDSIIAKVDNAGATIADWLILQGNIVIATDSVDGISRLATQTEANDGTEGGAVVITPATLQGKIDAQITPEISSKLPLAGGTMSGEIDMAGNNINTVQVLNVRELGSDYPVITLITPLNADGQIISDLPAPTDGGDAANKTYVDTTASTAQANAEATASADATTKADAAQAAAEAYADSLAPNYDAAGAAAQALTDANAYTNTGLATKLNLAGGDMSGAINMNGNAVYGANTLAGDEGHFNTIRSSTNADIKLFQPLDFQNSTKAINLAAPTEGGDATNKTYVDTTAATAEANANAYTDTAIADQSSFTSIASEDWLFEDGSYYFTLNHGLDSFFPLIQVMNNQREVIEMLTKPVSLNDVTVFSNILPTGNTAVIVMKAK